jgi:hypothetical protein
MVSFATPRCTRILLFAAALGALILAGCRGGDSSQSGVGTTPVSGVSGIWGQANWDQATWQ